MTTVQLRRHINDYPRDHVQTVIAELIRDPGLAYLIATWLTTIWDEDESDPPPLEAESIAAIYAGVTGRFT